MAENIKHDKQDKADPKEKGAKEQKEHKEKSEPAKKLDLPADFRHLVRLVNTDLDGKRPVGVALAYVPGVGKRLAYVVCTEAGVDPATRIGTLKDDQLAAVNTAIEGLTEMLPDWMVNRRKDPESGDDRHMIGTEITIMLREDLNRLKKIRSWRGHRHERKLPTRGQRTKNNGRFGAAVGVQRKAEPGAPAEGAPAAAAPKAAGGGGAKPLGGAKPAAAAPAAAAGGKPAAGAAKPAAGGAAKPAAPAGGKK